MPIRSPLVGASERCVALSTSCAREHSFPAVFGRARDRQKRIWFTVTKAAHGTPCAWRHSNRMFRNATNQTPYSRTCIRRRRLRRKPVEDMSDETTRHSLRSKQAWTRTHLLKREDSHTVSHFGLATMHLTARHGHLNILGKATEAVQLFVAAPSLGASHSRIESRGKLKRSVLWRVHAA